MLFDTEEPDPIGEDAGCSVTVVSAVVAGVARIAEVAVGEVDEVEGTGSTGSSVSGNNVSVFIAVWD